MATKTTAEREQEQARADCRVWDEFEPRLGGLQSVPGAIRLVSEGPPPGVPGRRYYSNLAFFLGSFNVPSGASHAELSLYLQFIRRIDNAGALKPGEGKKIQDALQQAMNDPTRP